MGSSSSKGRSDKTFEWLDRPKDLMQSKGRRRRKEAQERVSNDELMLPEGFGFPFTASDLERSETSDHDDDGEDSAERAADGEEPTAKGEASRLEALEEALEKEAQRNKVLRLRVEELEEALEEALEKEAQRNEALRLRVEELAATLLQQGGALHASSLLMAKITKDIPDQVEKQVNALIGSWLDSQLQVRAEKVFADYLERRRVSDGEQQDGGESGVQPAWTPAEQMNALRNVPTPLIKTKEFLVWLRTVCIVYALRPADISRLLLLAYGEKWEDVRRHFHIPGAAADHDWPDDHAMIRWLDGRCAASIKSAANSKLDLSAVHACIQKPKELVSDFLQRYEHVWDSTVGLSRADIDPLAVSILEDCLLPHVSDQFKLKCIDWQLYSFKKAKQVLLIMEQQGRFTSRGKSLRLAEMLKHSGPDGDRCSHCHKLGHWAEDCRSKLRFPAMMWIED